MIPPNDALRARVERLPGVEVVEADLGDSSAIQQAVAGSTSIIHLAAQLIRSDTSLERFFDVNAMGTLRLLEAASKSGLQRFVLASTDGTYRPGDPPAIPLSETDEQKPQEGYGTSKLVGEIILTNMAAFLECPT
jgi:UDP-glucose 4-epimerase